MKIFKAFIMAMSTYTSIRMPNVWDEKLRSLVVPTFPLVGLVVGGLWCLAAFILSSINAPVQIAGAIIFALPMMISGFIHIDGLMDTCDAVFSWADLEKRRAILKDSHIGAFAAIGLGMWLILGYGAAQAAYEKGIPLLALVLIPVVSRSLSGSLMLSLKSIWDSGYAASYQKNSKKLHAAVTALWGVLAIALGFFFGGLTVFFSLLALIIGGLLAAWFSVGQLKGISGDLCGFILTLSELSAVLLLSLI